MAIGLGKRHVVVGTVAHLEIGTRVTIQSGESRTLKGLWLKTKGNTQGLGLVGEPELVIEDRASRE